MGIETIPIKELWSLLIRLPKFILRRRFSRGKLAQLVYVDLRPRHDPATLNLGECAEFQLWLQIINLSPFEIELDRAEFSFWCGPKLGTAVLKRTKIQPGEISSLLLESVIPDGQADHIARTNSGNSCRLDGNLEFNCALHNFPKTFSLDGIKPRIVNGHVRVVSAR